MRIKVHSALVVNLDHFCKVQLENPPSSDQKVKDIGPDGKTEHFGRAVRLVDKVKGPVVAVGYEVQSHQPETLAFFPNFEAGVAWLHKLALAWGPPFPSLSP